MLSRRSFFLITRPYLISSTHQSIIPLILRRHYAANTAPEPKLHPLSGPIGDELDPRFSDLPPWKVPEVNRQTLTETPVVPYFDQQNRRYFGEPVSENDEILSVFAPDVHNHVTFWFAMKWFLGFAAVFTGVCYLLAKSWPGRIAMPRTYPYDGLAKELGPKVHKARKDEISSEEIS